MSFARESPSEIFLICTFQLFVMLGGTTWTPFTESPYQLRKPLERAGLWIFERTLSQP